MFKIGYGTIGLYLLSVIFFLFGMFYKDSALIFMGLAAVFFLVPSIIIGVMMKMRMES